jgi:hypothetical protein
VQRAPFEEKYRGYRITAKSVSGLWRVEVTPTQVDLPMQVDLPILRRHRFLIDAPSGEAAIEEARWKIDQLISD